jgi:tetratricopeptide (TPR) repeat protein
MRVARSALLLTLSFAAVVPASAQLRSSRPQQARRNLPRLMVANPYAPNSADSAAAVRVGDGMRQRMDGLASRWFVTITRNQMNEALLQYAYPADAVLAPMVSRTLATQLQARFLVSSTLARTEGGRYSVQVRAIGLNDKAGYTTTLTQQPAQTLEDFGKAAANTMEGAFKALEDAKKCWELQGTKPDDAVKAAESALRDQPGHGLAEYCIGEIAAARKAPGDSLIAAYERATKGDPLSLEAWSKLAIEYQQKGDSAGTVRVFQEMLRVAPTNQPLREQAFRLFITYGKPEAAKQVAEEGLALDPSNADLWDLKSNACLFLEDFPCAVDALEQVFSVDSAKADTSYYNKISVAASQKPDTVRLLKWARQGSSKFPSNATLLGHLANAYSVAGPLDSAVAVTTRLMAADSTDLTPALRTVQALVTAKRPADAYALGGYVERLGGADEKQNYALILINGALPLLQQEGQNLPVAAEMARKAVGLSVPGGRVAVNGNYVMGLADALQLPQLDGPIMEAGKATDKAEACRLTRGSEAILQEAAAALTAGQSVNPDAVAQYMRIVDGFRPRVESQLKAFCK